MSLLDTASLIVTPNAYKEGKLYSVIPSDGSGDMSVVRATTATRVNSAGLVELVPYNLLTYSEQFNNAAWFKDGATVTANDATAPDGTLTADKVVFSGANKTIRQELNMGGATITASVYIKGTAGQTIGIDDIFVTQQIVTLTGEWQRLQFTAASPNGYGLGVSTFGGVTATTIYVWGAQLVEGSVAKDYQKTETRLNIPRLDYSNGTCPSLLVEPQRTNLLTYSSSFDNAAWQKENASVTANTTTSPDGTQNADSLIEDSATLDHLLYQGDNPVAGAYTTSVFMKKNTRQFGFLQIATDTAVNRYTIVVDLNNGTMTASSTSGAPTGTSYKIDSIGNGWYRLSVTATHTVGLLYSVFGLSNSANPTFSAVATPLYSGDGTSSSYFWGAQIEAGSYSTSYIPTTSASVTRNADVISKTGISSLIGQTEGTLFVDLEDFIELDIPCLTIDNGTNDNRIVLYREFGTGYLGLFLAASGTIVTALSTTSASDGKIAIAYTGTTFVMYRNGVQILSTTSAIPSSMSAVRFNGRATNDFYTTRKIKSFALWKTRLTNTQLATLTTI